MTRKRKKVPVYHLSSEENTRMKMPRYNGWQPGTGVHGDTKYNRRKTQQEFRRLLDE